MLIPRSRASSNTAITQRFVELLQSGKIGTVHMAKVANIEFRPDIGRRPDEPVPEGVNYDLWTGPAPMLPFNRNRFHNTFKWHWNYGTGELGNNGSHWLDLCRWVLGVGLPTEISGMGRKLAFDDDKQTPDTDNLTFNYPDKVIAWEERLWTPYGFDGSENTMVFYGTEGMAHAGRWVGGRYAFKIFDPKGRYLLAFGGQGGKAGNFWLPSGLFIARDRIYVADSYNQRVQVFQFLGGG